MEIKEIESAVQQNKIRIVVKANAKKSEILSVDDAVHVAIAAPAEKNKANEEIVRFFSKLLKKKVRILSGLTRRNKVLQIRS